ncbi:MAG: alpha/beta hydrolase [Pseudomonadales bacterium]|nr:alpha/beta hydrolase [Pseudomonadales bacterium]
MSQSSLAHPTPPETSQLLWEFPKASLELMQLLYNKRWRNLLADAAPSDGHTVMTLPGFGGGDASMLFLRRYLNKLGYQAEPWRLGTNLPKGRTTQMAQIIDYCEDKEAQVIERCESLSEQSNEKISLIGWSMGGVFANAIAQKRPDLIRQVITLGAPIGDPRGTSMWSLLKRANRSDVPDDQQDVTPWLNRANQIAERKVHTAFIYSRSDGAVAPEVAVLPPSRFVENIEVVSSHVGFAHNPAVFWLIADRLSQHPSHWSAFEAQHQPSLVRKKLAR